MSVKWLAMNDATVISAEELDALRAQVVRQQVLLTEHEAELSEQQAQIALKDKQIDVHEDTIEWLKERLNYLLAKRYTHSSEQENALQGNLLEEEELEAQIKETQRQLDEAQEQMDNADAQANNADATDADAAKPDAKATGGSGNPFPEKERPKRKPLPAHLRRVIIDVDVSDEKKQAMGDEWEQIGWETSEQLACQDREYYVKQVRRAKYVRKTPDTQGGNSGGIMVAPTLPVILPRAIADASLLAKIVTGKFVDALSFNRECKVLEREGIQIGYSTLCSYPIQLTERLEGFRQLFYDYAAEQPLWHLDETTLQVLNEPDREARQKSYIWALRAGPPGAEVMIFHYDERRNYEALNNWLERPLLTFKGAIITDEHKPYARLTRETPGIEIRGGCWAHNRRKLTDAIKGRRDGSDAHKLIKDIATLYKLEAKVQSRPFEQRLQWREKLIRPWLDAYKKKVDALVPVYAKTGLMKTALGYTQNNWDALTAFMLHPHLPLDNNPVESSIRPFALGRRNWLYTASARGARASAFMYTLVESAKANGLEPKAYLQALFEHYPLATTVEERRQLLPMFIKMS